MHSDGDLQQHHPQDLTTSANVSQTSCSTWDNWPWAVHHLAMVSWARVFVWLV